MEKAKTRKIKKWDEIHGEYEVEVSEDMGGGSPEEAAGAGPSISRNPMKGIEDMVEQNDNNLDGVINNVKAEPAVGTLEIVPDDKKSVLEKLKEQSKQVTPPIPVPERKPVPGDHRMVERSKYIHIRVTPEEVDRIKERMEEAGIRSMTAYLLRMALNGFVIVMDLSDLKEILRLLQISGNNLNQYAKRANETGSIYREDIEELKNNQKEILQEMRKMLDKLTAIM